MKTAKLTSIIRRTFSVAAPAAAQLALTLFSALSATALALYLPVLAGRAIDLLSGAGRADITALAAVLARMAIAASLSALGQWLTAAFRSRAVARISGLADILPGIIRLLTGALTILAALVLMLRISAGTAAAVVLLTPAPRLAAAIFAVQTRDAQQLQSAVRNEQSALLHELIAGEKVVQAFGREHACQRRLDEVEARLGQASIRATLFSALTHSCTRLAYFLTLACAASLCALSAITSGPSTGELLCFLACAILYTRFCSEIPDLLIELHSAIRTSEPIDEAPSAEPAPDAPIEAESQSPVSTNFCQFTPSGY